MSDYTNSKPRIAGNFPNDVSKASGPGAAGFSRVTAFPTPDRIRDEYLFGIPLASFQTGQALSDKAVQNIINRCAANAELKLKVDIFPVQREVKKEWDRVKWLQGWNQINLNYKNISSVEELSIRTTNSISTNIPNPDPNQAAGTILYNIPIDWIDMGSLTRSGLIHLVPLQTAYSSTGFSGNITGPAAPLFAVFSQMQHIPSFWYCRFTCGFQENSLPEPIADYISLLASIEILGMIGPTNKYNSQSIGLDAASQSLGSAGPNIYQQRIQELQQRKLEAENLIKSRFNVKIMMDAL